MDNNFGFDHFFQQMDRFEDRFFKGFNDFSFSDRDNGTDDFFAIGDHFDKMFSRMRNFERKFMKNFGEEFRSLGYDEEGNSHKKKKQGGGKKSSGQ
mmetsp:Transcript_37881/g.33899  ORF Transcript_37881/g.33899 Transcript_37881/m.33899 type:complete len:96 (+) Transcript_37881:722-1009(+)